MIRLIRTKVLILVTGLLVVGAVGIVGLLHRSYESNIRLLSNEALLAARQGFSNLERDDVRTLTTTGQALMADERLRDLFVKRDLPGLEAATAPIFRQLKQQGITHWYFIEPAPATTCFLRVHQPKVRGDVIKRLTFRAALASSTTAAGKELGKTAFALRVVQPYRDQTGQVIGYLELGEEIEHFVTALKQQTGSEFGLLLSKEGLKRPDWVTARKAQGLRDNWDDQAESLLVTTTAADNPLLAFAGSLASIPDEGQVLGRVTRDDRAFVQGIIPLTDIAGKKVGGLFVLKDVTPLYAGLKATERSVIVLIGLMMLGICIVMVTTLKRLIFRRLDYTIDAATRVVGGDFETPIKQRGDDEIGAIESLLEQFRAVFVDTLRQAESKQAADARAAEKVANSKG